MIKWRTRVPEKMAMPYGRYEQNSKLFRPLVSPVFSKGTSRSSSLTLVSGTQPCARDPILFAFECTWCAQLLPALFGSIWIDFQCGWSSQPHSFAFHMQRVVTGTWCKMIGNVWFLHRCIANHHAIHSRHHLNSNSTCFRIFSLTEIWSHPFYSGNHHRRMSLSTHFPSLNLL